MYIRLPEWDVFLSGVAEDQRSEKQWWEVSGIRARGVEWVSDRQEWEDESGWSTEETQGDKGQKLHQG